MCAMLLLSRQVIFDAHKQLKTLKSVLEFTQSDETKGEFHERYPLRYGEESEYQRKEPL